MKPLSLSKENSVRTLFLGVFLLAVFANSFVRSQSDGEPAITFSGDKKSQVIGKGTLEPVEIVNVSAKAAGMIDKLGWDPRDEKLPLDKRRPLKPLTPVFGPFRDGKGKVIKEGTLLAIIDDKKYQLEVKKAAEALDQTKMERIQAEAMINRSKSRLEHLSSLELHAGRHSEEVDKEKLNLRKLSTAADNLNKKMSQDQIALRKASENLSNTRIVSPIDGSIFAIRAKAGQMVALEPNVSVLFVVGNINKLQIKLSIKEANIKYIYEKQHVKIYVDAYPNDVFEGEVKEILSNVGKTQNNSGYMVIVSVTPPNAKLLPYMTTTLRFE